MAMQPIDIENAKRNSQQYGIVPEQWPGPNSQWRTWEQWKQAYDRQMGSIQYEGRNPRIEGGRRRAREIGGNPMSPFDTKRRKSYNQVNKKWENAYDIIKTGGKYYYQNKSGGLMPMSEGLPLADWQREQIKRDPGELT